MRKLIFWIEVKFDNFKAKKRIKKLQKEYEALSWELQLLGKDDNEFTRNLENRVIQLQKQIKIEKLFILDI